MTDYAKFDKYMSIKEVDADGIAWHDPASKPFRLCGFYWYGRDKVYRRLPVKLDWPVSPGVEILANYTAGGQVRFRTDSKRIFVRYESHFDGRMHHMPDTGMSGLDLYLGAPGQERFWGVVRRSEFEGVYKYLLFDVPSGAMQDFVLNMPLYNGLKSLEVGVDEGAVIEPPRPFERENPVVVYGTSITQGGCASRPGMAYSNILSRKLNTEFLNLGFSGNGRCEADMARILAEIADPALFIIDCEANCADPDTFAARLPEFIRILREKHPVMPILVVSKINYQRVAHPCIAQAKDEQNRVMQMMLVSELRKAGDLNIRFMDGADLLQDDFDECTMDGVHPNDLGFYRMAEALYLPVLNLLRKEVANG